MGAKIFDSSFEVENIRDPKTKIINTLLRYVILILKYEDQSEKN